jgi:uncharacterized protein YicC (UPF0701 family)
LSKISADLNLTTDHTTLQAALRLPDVVKTEYQTLDEEEWGIILKNIRNAIADIDKFRVQEGDALKIDIIKSIELIQSLLDQIEPFEGQRIEALRTRLTENLDKLSLNGNVDKNRFEQELIFYLKNSISTKKKSAGQPLRIFYGYRCRACSNREKNWRLFRRKLAAK